MRRISLLFILFAYLSSVTEVHELFKAANLFAHYAQHLEHDDSLSFGDFLSMHYAENSEHASSEEHSESLPFKSNHTSTALISFVALIPAIGFEAIPLWVIEAATPVSFYKPIAASARVSAIWQPPKLS